MRRWRMRAEELRALAENFSHAGSRQTLRQIAETYDRLANSVEEMLEPAGRGPADKAG